MNGGAFGDQREDFTSVLGFLKTAVLETTGTKPGQVEALVAKKLMDRPFHLSNTEMTSAMVVPRRPCKRYKKVLTKMPLSTDDQKATEILKELSQPKPLTRVKVQKVKCRDMFRDMPKEAQKYTLR